jgi:nitrogenase molybdenum-cofactor synthesis protein NifE
VESEQKIPVIPVHSEGFRGTKKDGYKAACEALFRLIGQDESSPVSPGASISWETSTWRVRPG